MPAVAVCCVLALGCSTTDDATGGPERVVIETPERPVSIDASFVPAFDALRAAVDDGEDDVARRILAGILARRPRAELVEFARGFERILDGRAALADLDLALHAETVEGGGGDRHLVLVASHGQPVDITLQLPTGILRRMRTAIDPGGNESRSLTTEHTSAMGGLLIPAGETVRVPLFAFELELGGALAVRERWTIEALSGNVVVGGRELPAQDPLVEPCEAQRLAAFLPTDPVEPAELVRYLGEDEVFLPALIERAIRILPSRRGEALDALAPAVAELAAERPERIAEAAPALRWLTRSTDEGRDAAAWAAWFQRRDARRPAAERPSLELPDDLRTR